MDPSTDHAWPDSLDSTALLLFIVAALALPVVGYCCAVIDFRRYLRSLRRAISTIVYRDTGTPDWDQPAVPRCIAVFDLPWPCSEAELTSSYRQRSSTSTPIAAAIGADF